VFITGLSAGGAMTSVMLACYPEVFAAGAIIAGLPYGAASNVQEAFESMFQSPVRAASEWGDRVRAASPHSGPWPRISVWHGGADKTVIPANAREILKQWTELHGLPIAPAHEVIVDGYPRQVWRNQAGDEVIESYTITHMAHGTPLATGAADDACGVAGPFLIEAGISSSYHIARFFGLTAAGIRAVAPAIGVDIPLVPDRPPIGTLTATRMRPETTQDDVLEGEILDKDDPRPHDTTAQPLPIDIGAVIAKALTAAGLIKRPG
jgi:poly(3-hydroxybutyrate) depolymerase